MSDASTATPRVIDNDRDEITVTLNGRELRGYSYESEAERRAKMLAAREYVEGWYCGMQRSAELLAALKQARICLCDTARDRAAKSAIDAAIAKAEGGV